MGDRQQEPLGDVEVREVLCDAADAFVPRFLLRFLPVLDRFPVFRVLLVRSPKRLLREYSPRPPDLLRSCGAGLAYPAKYTPCLGPSYLLPSNQQ